MAIIIYILLLTVSVIHTASGYHRPDLPPGPYCGLGGDRGGCCEGRKDRCGHKILDTICYCDQFCKRSYGDDCCPDYEVVCLHETEAQREANCRLDDTKIKGCNTCTCNMVDGEPNWECESEDCLMSQDVVKGVNRLGSWKAGTYEQFATVNLRDALIYKLGTLPVEEQTLKMGSVHYMEDIPNLEEFDARKQFGRFISPVLDQRWCGSDWAVTIASIIADRFAIASEGTESLEMSPQSLISCNIDKRGRPSNITNNCKGGHIDHAWNYVRRHGIVDAPCFPYEGKDGSCPYNVLKDNLRSAGCLAQVESRTERYSVSVPYRLNTEKDIMYDLVKSGPVHAVMKVYQDFFHYRTGVYHHTNFGNQKVYGWHSVKIIGWGSDRGTKYWTAANTWGNNWGEDGHFRIVRGANESMIESFIVAATSLLAINQRI